MSCHSGVEPPVDDNTGPLIPLAVGNYWVYQEYDLNSDGSIRSANQYIRGYKITDTLSVNLDGTKQKTFRCNRCDSSTSWTSFDGRLLYNGNDGTYYAGVTDRDSVSTLFNDLMFKYPTNKGHETAARTFYYNIFCNFDNVPDSVITTYTCVSTDSLFSTPFGDFKCVVYKLKLMLDDYFYLGDVYYFFKPGLGMVGTIFMTYSYYSNEHYYFLKDVLIDYNLNK